jgi:DNA transformation protein
MAESAADIAFVRDLLSGLGPIDVRRMFGGAGIYAGGQMFGLLDDGRIYLKVDAVLKADMAAAGSVSWQYSRTDKVFEETSYWSLPESAIDDPDEACDWARRALAAAQALKAAGPKRKRKGPPPG